MTERSRTGNLLDQLGRIVWENSWRFVVSKHGRCKLSTELLLLSFYLYILPCLLLNVVISYVYMCACACPWNWIAPCSHSVREIPSHGHIQGDSPNTCTSCTHFCAYAVQHGRETKAMPCLESNWPPSRAALLLGRRKWMYLCSNNSCWQQHLLFILILFL